MFRIFVLLITLFASSSVFSGTDQANLSLHTANTIELTADTTNLESELSDTTPLSSVDNTPQHPLSENHSQSLDFSQTIRANLLTHKLPQTPEYVLVYELLSVQLDVFADHEDSLAKAPTVWFMHFSDSSSRLSGWKDSNSLYSAKATYHLS